MEIMKHLDLKMASPAWTGEYNDLRSNLVIVTKEKKTPNQTHCQLAGLRKYWLQVTTGLRLCFSKSSSASTWKKRNPPAIPLVFVTSLWTNYYYTTASHERPHLHCSRQSAIPPLKKQNKTKQVVSPKPTWLLEHQLWVRPDAATAMPTALPQAVSYVSPYWRWCLRT